VKIKSILPYFGGKRMQSKGIIEALGSHSAYFEPFCGSLSVLLAKPRSSMEVVNDLHGGVVNLARVIRDDPVKLYEKLSRTLFCEELHNDSIDKCFEEEFSSPLDWAYNYFVASWMGRNGLTGTTKELETGFCKRFTSSGGDSATRFRNATESIPEWHHRLRGVTIMQQDAFDMIPKIEDKEGTVVYVDSPYVVKDAEYLHDFKTEDHEKLAKALRRFEKSRVVVSYYDHSLIDSLYLDFGFTKTLKTTKKQMSNGAADAPEVLLIKNGA
jgi:DNA adenine methylase